MNSFITIGLRDVNLKKTNMSMLMNNLVIIIGTHRVHVVSAVRAVVHTGLVMFDTVLIAFLKAVSCQLFFCFSFRGVKVKNSHL